MFGPPREPDEAVRAVLVTIAPATLGAAMVPASAAARGVPASSIGAGAALMMLLGVTRLDRPAGRIAASAGLVVALLGWSIAHPGRPDLGFLWVVSAILIGSGIWPSARRGSWWQMVAPVPAAAIAALVVIVYGWISSLDGPGADVAAAASAAVPGAVAFGRADGRGGRQLAAVAVLAPLVFAAFRLAGALPPRAIALVALGPLLLLSRAPPPEHVWRPGWRLFLDLVVASPPRVIVTTFAACCVFGGILLTLPVSDATGAGIAPLDALFMATSATCVTGLAVIDPATRLTGFGKVVLLLLVQVGGLGIMTFASAGALAAGRRLGVRQEATAAEFLGRGARGDLGGALRRVLLYTGVSEAAAAVLLFPALLLHGDGVLAATWEAVFTSISAFCNAGFALQTDNLVAYQRDEWILLVVSVAILAGSIGPAVTLSLPALVRRRRVPMYVRLSATMLVALLAGPFLLVLALEWSHALAALNVPEKLANAWFFVVTPRTAGFNSIDMTSIGPGVWTLTVLLMLVGGNTGSTAGGLKVTTVGVLVVSVLAELRGRRDPEYGYRSIATRTVREALALTGIYALAVAVALFLLQLSQQGLSLELALFEVVSALGTVGLTVGATPRLDAIGKVVIIACMFAGRVGPLTLFLFLSERERERAPSPWPQEEVPVG